jgi:hypothetical protein
MPNRTLAGAGAALAVAAAFVLAPRAATNTPAERFWPQWRGPYATGVSKLATPPTEWSESKNVRWKTEIPGRGSASPVVWGDKVFVLSAVPIGVTGDEAHAPRGRSLDPHTFMVLAIDRTSGRIAWQQVAAEQAPHEAAHRENGTWASSSAVTDGEQVFASFESRGIFAYDMNGKLRWKKDLGDKQMRNQFGEGSTPALHGNRLVLVWDHQGESFIVALDKRTGDEIWRVPRDEIDSWATPLIVEHGGRAQVIASGMNRLRSYDLETGKIVWESEGLTMNPIPSPVAGEGIVYATSGFRGNKLLAIRLADAKGDLTNSSAIVWRLDRDTPYVPSPLLYEGVLYFLKSNNGILSALDARNGTPHYQATRVEGLTEVYASPVAAQNRVYIAGRNGATVVLRHGPKLDVLATNTLEDGFDASPALVDGEIYMRGYKHLYCIAEK